MTRVPAGGISLWLELTPRCNLGCAFCYNPWRPEPAAAHPPALEAAGYIAAIEPLIVRHAFDYVALSGGEPLLYSGLEQLTAALARHGQRPLLTTNGRLLTRARLERLRDAGLVAVQVPLLAATPEVHDRLSGRRCWRQALRALALGLEHGLSTAATFVATQENCDELPSTVELLASLGVRRLVVNELHARGAAEGRPELSVAPAALKRQLHAASAAGERRGVDVCFVAASDELDHRSGPLSAWHRLAVAPDGQLKLCNQSRTTLGALGQLGDAELERIVADLATGTLAPYRRRVDSCSCFERASGAPSSQVALASR